MNVLFMKLNLKFWGHSRWRKMSGGPEKLEYVISYDFRKLNEIATEISLDNREEVIKTILQIDTNTFFFAGPVTTTIIFNSSLIRKVWIEKLESLNSFNFVLFLIEIDFADVHLQKNYSSLNMNFLEIVNKVRKELGLGEQIANT